MVTVTFLRASASTVALVTIYYLLPLDRASIGAAVAILAVGLAAFVALVTVQVRLIIRAEHPALRGVGALATSAPMFLLLFAATYYVIDGISPDSFSQSLTRTGALYFTCYRVRHSRVRRHCCDDRVDSCPGHRSDGRRHRDRRCRCEDHCRCDQARTRATAGARRGVRPRKSQLSAVAAPLGCRECL